MNDRSVEGKKTIADGRADRWGWRCLEQSRSWKTRWYGGRQLKQSRTRGRRLSWCGWYRHKQDWSWSGTQARCNKEIAQTPKDNMDVITACKLQRIREESTWIKDETHMIPCASTMKLGDEFKIVDGCSLKGEDELDKLAWTRWRQSWRWSHGKISEEARLADNRRRVVRC